MKFTSNYNLKKPDGTDFYNIDDMNNNSEIIDVELKKINSEFLNKAPINHTHTLNDVNDLQESLNDKVTVNQIKDWKEISLSEFADMISLITASDMDIRYNPSLSEIRFHLRPICLSDEGYVNTGDVIGTVKEAYRPTFTQYGICVIKSAGKEYIRSVEINSEGKITISNNGETATFIDNILSLDLTYNL